MRRGLRTWHTGAMVTVVVFTALAAGCQHTRFAEAKQVRDERIRDLGRTYAAREAACYENLGDLADVCRESRARHARQLRNITTLVGVEFQRDVNRWRDQSPARRAYWRSVLDGRPEKIPDFVVEAIY